MQLHLQLELGPTHTDAHLDSLKQAANEQLARLGGNNRGNGLLKLEYYRILQCIEI